MGVESRIYGRLHWDKALTNAPIQLEVQPGGVAVLTGSVPDATAKVKAETLAADTVGVTKVVNQLAVATPSATTTITPRHPGPAPEPDRQIEWRRAGPPVEGQGPALSSRLGRFSRRSS